MQLIKVHFKAPLLKNIFFVLTVFFLPFFISFVSANTPAPEKSAQNSHKTHQSESPAKGPNPSTPLGVKERLGEEIPTDLLFLDEHNAPVRLNELITKPTLILPVYFHCPNTCPLLMANLAQALNDVILRPGEDFQVIAFSFDPEDTPEFALKAKNNYLPIIKKKFPKTAWTFLTGSPQAISTLTKSIGFQYQQTSKHFFNHPSVLVTVSKSGQIIRYIYGPDFLPFDISMALSEAEKGTPSVSIKKLLTFCFSYDPAGKKYVFNTFKLVAISTILILVFFYLLVLRKGNK